MSKIVLEDFNEGGGFYKVNLAYLNKEQVEEIEAIVSKWNLTDEDMKDCIGMCLTDVDEQRFRDYNTNLRDCLDWLEKQSESDETKVKMFLINKGYPIDTNGIFPTYEEMYNIIKEGLEKQGETYTKKDVDDAFVEGMAFAKKELEKQGNKETLCDKCRKEQPSHSCQDITANGRCYIEGMNISNNIKPKFGKGDWIIHQGTENIYQVVACIDNQYQLKYGDNYTIQKCADVDKYARLWNISDAKDGDVLACGNKVTDCPFIFHNLTEELNPRSYCGINKLLHFQDNDENGGFWCHSYEVRPATKEQRDFLFAKMKEAGYEWNAELKEVKTIFTPADIDDTIRVIDIL